jgi:type II secretory pathway component PulF
MAALWPAAFALAAFVADQLSFDAEFLKSIWLSAIPALAGAAAASYFVPSQWAQRAWTGWLLIVPIGGLVVLGYSLKQYFLR